MRKQSFIIEACLMPGIVVGCHLLCLGSCLARGVVLQLFVQPYHRLLSAFWHFYNQCLFNSFRQVIWLECESKVSYTSRKAVIWADRAQELSVDQKGRLSLMYGDGGRCKISRQRGLSSNQKMNKKCRSVRSNKSARVNRKRERERTIAATPRLAPQSQGC